MVEDHTQTVQPLDIACISGQMGKPVGLILGTRYNRLDLRVLLHDPKQDRQHFFICEGPCRYCSCVL